MHMYMHIHGHVSTVLSAHHSGRQSARARERSLASSSLYPQAVQDFCKILLTKISSHRHVMSHVAVHSEFFIRTYCSVYFIFNS